MSIANDNGVYKGIDIYSNNKQEIRRRFALLALNPLYRIDTDSFDPQYTKIQTTDYRMEVYFGCANDGLRTTAPQRLKWFEISGKNRIFFQTDVDIKKHSAVLQNQNLDRPNAMRYASTDNPECTLLNGFGLLAGPFQAEYWPELIRRE